LDHEKELILTPEMSIQHQNRIGGDIIMALGEKRDDG